MMTSSLLHRTRIYKTSVKLKKNTIVQRIDIELVVGVFYNTFLTLHG